MSTGPERRQGAFLRLVAHELRNFLASMRNAVDVLQRIPLRDRRQEQARDVLDGELSRLTLLLEDLLDVLRGPTNGDEPGVDTAAAQDVVARAVGLARLALAGRGVEVVAEDVDGDVALAANGERLARALAALLEHAARSADSGPVRIRCSADAEGARLAVLRRGPPLSAAEAARPFELDAMTDEELAPRALSVGLGATLAKQLIESLGGWIEVRTDGDAGAVEYAVRIPRAAVEPSASNDAVALEPSASNDAVAVEPSASNGAVAVPAPRLAPRTRAHRILVVDDNVDAARSLALLLALAGHAVEAVHDGADAIAAAQALHPDVVFLDIGLPGIDGYEVARRLRALEGLEKALIVAITGFDRERDRQRSRQAGIDRFLTKPVDPAALERLLP